MNIWKLEKRFKFPLFLCPYLFHLSKHILRTRTEIAAAEAAAAGAAAAANTLFGDSETRELYVPT